MPVFLKKDTLQPYFYTVGVLMIILILFIAYYNYWLSLAALTVFIFFAAVVLKQSRLIRKETKKYIDGLSLRLKEAGKETIHNMPVGILIINDEYYIEWANPFMKESLGEETLIGRSLYDVSDSIIPMIKQELKSETIPLNDQIFRIFYQKENNILYFFDITEQAIFEKQYEEEKPVIAIVYLDNYDDVTQGLDDQARGSLNSKVTSLLNQWAHEYDMYLKRINSDRFIAFSNERTLEMLEKERFSILDDLRDITTKNKLPLTLSIGVGTGVTSLQELGDLAQSSLDLALGRGGDQVAIKMPNGKVKFYGGKTNPMEKRTRVRARVISQALGELIQESKRVFIMGHKFPDMDAVGASIGVLKIAQLFQKEAYIVLDKQDVGNSVSKLFNEIKQRSNIYQYFISPEAALEMAVSNSLLVVVDTHKPSLVIEERLVSRIDRIIVIDHHRRSEEFVRNPLLVYMEPYASSTSELVTELLEYQPDVKIDILEATALLAGIIVDTKSFTLRTGSRTFDAASFLRSKGADTVLVQKFLKEDMQTYLNKADLLKRAHIYKNGIAIAKGDPGAFYDQVLIAQTSDTLLTLENVEASFVISNRPDRTIGISARSLGKVNVQLIMEQLDGGGHLTNAATQLSNMTIDEAEEKLKAAIDEHLEGGNKL